MAMYTRESSMPTIAEVLRSGKPKPPAGLPALQRKLLEYLEDHPDEVFGYEHTAELAAKLGGVSGPTVEWHLLSLDTKGLIAKARLGRKPYFGSRWAINHLLLASISLRDANGKGREPSLSPVAASDWIG